MTDQQPTSESKPIPEWDVDEDRQVVIIGLVALAFALIVGGAIAGWRLLPFDFGDDAAAAVDGLDPTRARTGSAGADDLLADNLLNDEQSADLLALPAPTTTTATTIADEDAGTTVTSAPTTTTPITAAPASTAPPTTAAPAGPSDTDIEAEVQGLLDSRFFTATGRVESGVATLTGVIPTEADRDPLLASAAATPGVVRVVDELTTLEGPMAAALSEWSGVSQRFDGYSVTLTGVVADPAARDAVIAAAEAVPGHDGVIDELQIQTEIDEARINELLGLDPIVFASGSAEIQADSLVVLDQAVEVLSTTAGPVTVEGHTDSRGDAEANKELSQARADAVVAYLASHGIDADRLTAIGYGEEQLLVDPDDTPEAQQTNRRIEFRLG